MLTVRDGEDDKVQALESGADDYITKPFQMRELTARIRSAVRRFRAPLVPAGDILAVGSIMLDPGRRRVEKAGASIRLTPREFSAVHFLMENAGKPLTYRTLLVHLWGAESGGSRESLRVLISNLRAKLEDDPGKPEYLLTDSYIGYRFRDK